MPNQKPTQSSSKATPNSTDQLNAVHNMLSSPRRRYLLRTLHEKGPLHKKELARYVAAIENNKHPDELEDQEHKRVVISLHEYHLPPLSENGFISWDTATNMVSLGPHSKVVLKYLDGVTVESETDGSVERDSVGSFADQIAKGVNSLF